MAGPGGRRYQSSFSAGELDPALQERTTLEKYMTGLATGRNIFVGKTGRLISRFGSRFVYTKAATYQKNVQVYTTNYKFGYYIVVYEGKIDVYDNNHDLFSTHTVSFTDEDIPKLHFAYDASWSAVYIFLDGTQMMTVEFGSVTTISGNSSLIYFNPAPAGTTGFTNGGTGYRVDYAITFVNQNNQESQAKIISNASYLQVITASTKNDIQQAITGFTAPREMRVYRRPYNGGAFGYIGSAFTVVSSNFNFTDSGQAADYSQAPPDYIYDFGADISLVSNVYEAKPRTGIVYQQRVIISGTRNKEVIHASRSGISRNWTRDYPLTSASGLTFKIGTDGGGEILRFLDAGPLLAFTTKGLYSNEVGPLTGSNMAMVQRGEGIIQEDLPPLKVPGAILFVDTRTNSIMAINYSLESVGFTGEEVSIYSDHLLRGRTVTSWTFADGDYPVVICTMSDGDMIIFSYQREQQLRAWTRWDSRGGFVKRVVSKPKSQGDYYIGKKIETGTEIMLWVERNGTDVLEIYDSRDITTIPLREFNGFDSTVLWNLPYNFTDMGGYQAPNKVTVHNEVAPGVFNDWDEELLLRSVNFEWIFDASNVGDVIRYFYDDQSFIDFTITDAISESVVKVQPSRTFDSTQALTPRYIYETTNFVDGLDHLAGLEVSVHVDGYVVSSPLNQPEEYETITVNDDGEITLPDGMTGAFIKIGIPIVNDIETLDVTTVEQKPTVLESQQAAKIYISLFNSRGVYTGQEFPDDDTVVDMESTETRDAELDVDGNAPQLPYTKREEVPNPSAWESNGRVCVRAVDGLPVEVLAIVPDLDIFRKGG